MAKIRRIRSWYQRAKITQNVSGEATAAELEEWAMKWNEKANTHSSSKSSPSSGSSPVLLRRSSSLILRKFRGVATMLIIVAYKVGICGTLEKSFVCTAVCVRGRPHSHH